MKLRPVFLKSRRSCSTLIKFCRIDSCFTLIELLACRGVVRRTKRSSNFTLIELLVVVAIIAILAAILLPALRSAKEQAQRVLCLNNHKQLNLGIQNYANEFDGWLMPAPAYGFTIDSSASSAIEPRGFGYLFAYGILPNQSTDLLNDPTYQNVNDGTSGNDGWFNAFAQTAHQGWTNIAHWYRSPSVFYGGARMPVPEHWNNGVINWWSSNPNGTSDAFKISQKYANDIQPIRTTCSWNTGGLPGVAPSGSQWLNLYTHRCRGVNMSFNDGSGKWVKASTTHNRPPEGSVHGHWRCNFWHYGKMYKDD